MSVWCLAPAGCDQTAAAVVPEVVGLLSISRLAQPNNVLSIFPSKIGTPHSTHLLITSWRSIPDSFASSVGVRWLDIGSFLLVLFGTCVHYPTLTGGTQLEHPWVPCNGTGLRGKQAPEAAFSSRWCAVALGMRHGRIVIKLSGAALSGSELVGLEAAA